MNLDQTNPQPTAATPAEIISNAVASFQTDVTIAQIEEMKSIAETLNIAGEADKVGYNQVDEARKEVKRRRLAITNREKQLLELPKNFTKAVKDEAKKYVDLLKPIEDGLQFKQKAIDDIKAERERKEQEKINSRKTELYSIGMLGNHELTFIFPEDQSICITLAEIKSFSDEQFNELKSKVFAFQEAKKQAEIERQEAERQRQAAESAERAKAAEAARQQLAQNAAPPVNNTTFQPQPQAPQPAPSSFPPQAPQPARSEFPPQQPQAPQPVNIPNTRQAPAPQQPTPPQNGYEIGFNEAKRRILEILSNPEPTTRKILFETIQNLKP